MLTSFTNFSLFSFDYPLSVSLVPMCSVYPLLFYIYLQITKIVYHPLILHALGVQLKLLKRSPHINISFQLSQIRLNHIDQEFICYEALFNIFK